MYLTRSKSKKKKKKQELAPTQEGAGPPGEGPTPRPQLPPAPPLPKTHGSSVRGCCRRGPRPGRPLPLGWLSPSSPSLWDQGTALVPLPPVLHPQQLWGREGAVASLRGQVCLQQEERTCMFQVIPARCLFEVTNWGGDGGGSRSRPSRPLPSPHRPASLLRRCPTPPTHNVCEQASPSLDTCQNSKATLKAWATVRVTA